MISFPFDSQITGTDEAGLPIYDRASNSEDLARWFAAFFTNGIFASSGFAVTVSGLMVSVSPGDCLINGRYGYEKNIRTFEIAGGGSQPRIDSIVLRLDMSLNKRSIDLYVKTGSAATTPVAPALERNEIVWELGVANIRVNATQTAVSQSAVTDTRLDTSRCGIVAQAMKTIDTSTYYSQIQADLAYFKATEQEAFDAWFESVQNTLDGDVAGNLLNLINEKVGLNTTTVTLLASGWENDRQTVSVDGVAANTPKIDVSPEPNSDSWDDYVDCGVRGVAHGDGTITFSCVDTPENDIVVQVAIFN